MIGNDIGTPIHDKLRAEIWQQQVDDFMPGIPRRFAGFWYWFAFSLLVVAAVGAAVGAAVWA